MPALRAKVGPQPQQSGKNREVIHGIHGQSPPNEPDCGEEGAEATSGDEAAFATATSQPELLTGRCADTTTLDQRVDGTGAHRCAGTRAPVRRPAFQRRSRHNGVASRARRFSTSASAMWLVAPSVSTAAAAQHNYK